MNEKSGTNGLLTKRNIIRAVFVAALAVVVFTGLYLWKFTAPVFCEYSLNLKNGYSLTLRTPEDWILDEKETNELRGVFSKISLPKGSDISHIVFKRNIPKGLIAWADELLNGRDIYFNLPKTTRIQCVSTPAIGKTDTSSELRSEMAKEQMQVSAKPYLSLNPKVEMYNLCPLGSGFKVVLTSRKFKVRSTGKDNPQHASTSISIFTSTPNKEKNLTISLHDGYRTSNSASMETEMDAIAASFKIVPNEQTNEASKAKSEYRDHE